MKRELLGGVFVTVVNGWDLGTTLALLERTLMSVYAQVEVAV